MWAERRSNQQNKRSEYDHRSPFERDNTRVIHSAAFRRLQRKTQILSTNEGDFHRTRLTHSLEVASIAKSIVRNLNLRADSANFLPSDDLIATISLLHDIGHPPFGHGGEVALNYMMQQHGGFESNGQTLRLITKIENSYGQFGLDLTRRTLLGILKYPASYPSVCQTEFKPCKKGAPIRMNDWHPPKCYLEAEQDVVDWVLQPLSDEQKALFQQLKTPPSKTEHGTTRFQSLDCSIMNIADDIAYGVHDFEDAVHLKLIDRDVLETEAFYQHYELANHQNSLPPQDEILDKLFHAEPYIRKNAIGQLVNLFITTTEVKNHHNQANQFDQPLLDLTLELNKESRPLLHLLKSIIYDFVIDSPEARAIEYGGQTVISRLFEAIQSNPMSLLNINFRKKYQNAKDDKEAQRVICDYIANMTDEYAYRYHEKLFGFNTRNLFERF